MSEFDYGNARLRAMKSRLLSRRALEALAAAESIDGLITALTNTAYREAVETALVRLMGMECLAEALRNDLVSAVGNARRFFPPDSLAGEMAATVLRRYDVHNVKALLRGLARHVPSSEILASTLPVGELRPPDLAELARAPNVATAIDLLATWRVSLARPLLERRGLRRAGSLETSEMDLALDRWYVSSAMQVARAGGEAGQPLLEALMLEADVANLMTALRLVGATDVVATLRAHYGTEEVTALFIGPGRIPLPVLSEAARKTTVAEAIDLFAATPYGATLAQVMAGRAAAGHLSLFERALARRQLQFAANLLTWDTLGIGVLLGYVALKTNEIANLRSIAQGLLLGDKPDRIRDDLMIVD